jgi:predicted metal-dependent HD superfamily phosphohydrolase
VLGATVFNRESLTKCLSEIGVIPTKFIFDELREAYTEPGRYYHTDKHVAECLAHFDQVRSLSHRPAEIEVALWFHDAVYDTRQSDNEERSAEWAKSFLSDVRTSTQIIDRIVQLILATKTHEPYDADAELMLDVDLGILGSPSGSFERYDSAIRQEYHWVPQDQYRTGRAQILTTFIERPQIYNTATFQKKYEQQARENLKKKIEELRLT